MNLLGRRSLAHGLRLVVELSIIAFIILLGWVLVILTSQLLGDEPHRRQGTVSVEIKLPTETVEPATADVHVYNVESSRLRIHYETPSVGALDAALTLASTIVGFGIILGILVMVRQILSSLVAEQPLTMANARRIRILGLLLLGWVVFSPVVGTLEYQALQRLFLTIPNRGVLDLLADHFDKTRFIEALLILLLGEVMRLGTEHRIDSESVI